LPVAYRDTNDIVTIHFTRIDAALAHVVFLNCCYSAIRLMLID